MPLVSMRQLLDHAAENSYGLPAFNVNNLEQVQAIMEAADELNSPVIMQASCRRAQICGRDLSEISDPGRSRKLSRIFRRHASRSRSISGGVRLTAIRSWVFQCDDGRLADGRW